MCVCVCCYLLCCCWFSIQKLCYYNLLLGWGEVSFLCVCVCVFGRVTYIVLHLQYYPWWVTILLLRSFFFKFWSLANWFIFAAVNPSLRTTPFRMVLKDRFHCRYWHHQCVLLSVSHLRSVSQNGMGWRMFSWVSPYLKKGGQKQLLFSSQPQCHSVKMCASAPLSLMTKAGSVGHVSCQPYNIGQGGNGSLTLHVGAVNVFLPSWS